ncbi:MAG: hypothetical protein ACK5RC_08360 [Curvibacter sp.]|jgi:hypothetical protein|nr:hypothetical protein [Curvibacter sp.]
MQSAPAVTYPVGRCFVRSLLHLVPITLGGLVCLIWFSHAVVPSGSRGIALLLWLLLATWVAWAWLHPAQGRLVWDGRIWSWHSQGATSQGRVKALLDWQDGLLMEFVPEHGRTVWLWPERSSAPAAWAGLRRAVFSSRVGLTSAGPGERA